MTKDINVTIRLNTEELRRLDNFKAETGLSRGEIMRQLLERAEVDRSPRVILRRE